MCLVGHTFIHGTHSIMVRGYGPAHLYMPQLLTHCLPIICYADVYCVCTVKQNVLCTLLRVLFFALNI